MGVKKITSIKFLVHSPHQSGQSAHTWTPDLTWVDCSIKPLPPMHVLMVLAVVCKLGVTDQTFFNRRIRTSSSGNAVTNAACALLASKKDFWHAGGPWKVRRLQIVMLAGAPYRTCRGLGAIKKGFPKGSPFIQQRRDEGGTRSCFDLEFVNDTCGHSAGQLTANEADGMGLGDGTLGGPSLPVSVGKRQ
jgi:hypothetical protein